MAGASSETSPASTSCITCAAMIGFVPLAMPNWLSGCMSWTPSAVPAAPLQVPSAVITVADTPPPPAMPSSAACNFAANSSVTGDSLMAANMAMGKGAACSGDSRRYGRHPSFRPGP